MVPGLALIVSQEFAIEIPDAEADEIQTVQQAIDYIAKTPEGALSVSALVFSIAHMSGSSMSVSRLLYSLTSFLQSELLECKA